MVVSRSIWPKSDNITFNFKYLKFFEMIICYGSRSEIKFIKFIIGSAPLLVVINLKWAFHGKPSIERKMDVLKKLLSIKRASTSAKIKIE